VLYVPCGDVCEMGLRVFYIGEVWTSVVGEVCGVWFMVSCDGWVGVRVCLGGGHVMVCCVIG
jgi:hypothetical protein